MSVTPERCFAWMTFGRKIVMEENMVIPDITATLGPPRSRPGWVRRYARVCSLLLIGTTSVFVGCSDEVMSVEPQEEPHPPAPPPAGGEGEKDAAPSLPEGYLEGRGSVDHLFDDIDAQLSPFREPALLATECCSEAGQITECWMQDAEDDGVTCDEDDDCPFGQCNLLLGVCKCDSDDDCADGLCTPNGLCGPKWCNGYRTCSCFGGCESSDPDHSPEEVCTSNDYVCCDGNYPVHPQLRGEDFGEIGFCSTNADCLISFCTEDDDCPDDGDACTVEECDTASGECRHELSDTICDDDNPCTADSCDPIDGCRNAAITGPCDDGNECTENDVCTGGECRGSVAECDDANPCTDDSCDDDAGCVYTFNTDPCNDGDACTVNDVCGEGVCGGAARNCSDGNHCTDDSCDSSAGCVYAYNTAHCDDFNACTEGDTCSDGTCFGGEAPDCDDGNPCTDDTCDVVLGCVNVDNTDPCDDGNECTEGDVCTAGVCAGTADVVCDDDNDCTEDTCVPASGCRFSNITAPCDDENTCTEGDACSGGLCQGTVADCDDGNYCTDDFCSPELGCEHSENTMACDDFNLCTVNDRCSGGECGGIIVHWRFEEDFWDGHDGDVKDHAGLYPATTENEVSLVPGKVGQGIRFGPGNGSNVGKAGTGFHVNADTSTLAFWVKFDSVEGEHQTIGAFSGAGKRFYLGIDRDNNIMAGYGNKFVGWSKPSVPSTIEPGEWVRMVMSYDGEMVHVYVDNVELISFEATFHGGGLGPEFFLGTNAGNVEIDEVVVDETYWPPEEVGIDYDDGNGPDPYRYTVNCDDDNPCTDDTCVAAEGCVNTPISGLCDDGNACTEDDVCAAGACTGSSIVCDDENPCTTDSCDAAAGCVFTDNTVDCDDGDKCTTDDVCADGECAGISRDCSDDNPCTDDACDPSSGCTHVDNTLGCDDDNACTLNDACVAGDCVGEVAACDDGNRCTTDTCNPTTGCVNAAISPCPDCVADTDCEGQVACNDCGTVRCSDGSCICDPLGAGAACDDYSVADFPPNCFHGECTDSGACTPTRHAAGNNLCSDLFTSGAVDTGHVAYLGAIPIDGDFLQVTGSTLCAENNYYAEGGDCDEYLTGNQIGYEGRDLVYAFQYQTNAADEFELYSYILKVEADYDIGVYIKTDISSPSDCPEGNNPTLDAHTETFVAVESRRCFYPYQDDPMPPVVEDECRDDGNTRYGQECCDPCTDDNCYKWCKRGYNHDGSSCDICAGAGGPGYDPWTFKGDCDAMWSYPHDPFNCDSATPNDTGYDDYNYIASAVISPKGETDGSTKTVFVFIDGVDGSQGNFYVTVEKRRWWAGPCDRVNDDGRVYDVTNVGETGETFQGTLESTVNSFHACGGDCGGYGCDCGWTGRSSCHQNAAATELWPNQEYFKIHRNAFEGSATYCISSDETIADGADLVMALKKRRNGADTICDESYSTVGCRHDSHGDNVQWEFTADPNTLYLVEISQYAKINRLCTPSAGDDCNYRINVREGACPVACRDVTAWYSNGVEGAYTVNADGSGFLPDSDINGGTNDESNRFDTSGGWGGKDELWQIDVSTDSRVRFSGCRDGGSGSFNGQMALFNCAGQMVAQNDNGCGWYGMPEFTVDLSALSQPYYLLVDGYDNNDKGNFSIGMSYQ